MKLLKHERVPWAESMTIPSQPMIIFITRYYELHIEKGDLLGHVAAVVCMHCPFDYDDACDIVGLWFALGERRAAHADGPWEENEISSDINRKYSPVDRPVSTLYAKKPRKKVIRTQHEAYLFSKKPKKSKRVLYPV